MKLLRLLEGVEYSLIQGQDVDITAAETDSRLISHGGLFICIDGLTIDGHNYIEEAVKNGARAVLYSDKESKIPEGVTGALTKDTRRASCYVYANYFNNPARSLRLTGITGTKGKTSTSYYIASILQSCGIKCGVIGTTGARINGEDIGVRFKTATTPDPAELHSIFAVMKERGVTDVIMEVSSHALALRKLEGIEFAVGVLTNVKHDHLDFHKTHDAYKAAKAVLFEKCAHSVLNADDPAWRFMLDFAKGASTTYAIESDADFKAENIEPHSGSIEFDITINTKRHHFCVNIPGKFTVYNVLSAVGAACALGFPMEVIKKAAAELKAVPGRFEPVPNEKGISVIVDYAHTADSLKNIIESVRAFTKRGARVITVFGCGGDRDKLKRPIMGQISAQLSDYCIITSDNPRSEEPMDIIREVAAGIIPTGCMYTLEPDRRKAIFAAVNAAKPGDSVIIAGKGDETYQEFKNKVRIDFDDRLVAQEALQGK